MRITYYGTGAGEAWPGVFCQCRVCREARRMGAARRLLEEGMAIAREEGYQGVSTICQDNNLNAALFYLNSGFAIVGLDTRVYDGTKQAGKSDIFLYRAL